MFILHIPHSSVAVPLEIRKSNILSDEDLQHELLVMTDRYTDELFVNAIPDAAKVVFPISRLVVDPERFEDDSQEPMSVPPRY